MVSARGTSRSPARGIRPRPDVRARRWGPARSCPGSLFVPRRGRPRALSSSRPPRPPRPACFCARPHCRVQPRDGGFCPSPAPVADPGERTRPGVRPSFSAKAQSTTTPWPRKIRLLSRHRSGRPAGQGSGIRMILPAAQDSGDEQVRRMASANANAIRGQLSIVQADAADRALTDPC